MQMLERSVNRPCSELKAFYASMNGKCVTRLSSLAIALSRVEEGGDDCSVDARINYFASGASQHRLPRSQSRNHGVRCEHPYTCPCGSLCVCPAIACRRCTSLGYPTAPKKLTLAVPSVTMVSIAIVKTVESHERDQGAKRWPCEDLVAFS